MKRIENDFLAVDKILYVAKNSFFIDITSKYALFSLGQNVLSGQKDILSSGQMDGALVQSFCQVQKINPCHVRLVYEA